MRRPPPAWILAAIVVSLFVSACPTPVMRDVLRYAEDTIPPVITVDAPANRSALASTVTFTGTVIDSAVQAGDGAGQVASLTYTVVDHESLNGAATVDPQTGAFAFTIDTSTLHGNQTINLTATDWNGNRTPFPIELVDSGVGPDISIGSPAQSSVYLSAVTVSGVVNDLGDAVSVGEVASLRYEVLGSAIDGDVAFDATTGAFSFTFSTVGLTGRIVVRLTATDRNGRENRSDLELLDVGLGPAVTVTTPAPYSAYGTTVSISGSVTNRTNPSSADEVQTLTYQVLNYPTVTGQVTFDGVTGAFNFSFSTLAPVLMTAQTLAIRLTATDKNTRTTVLDYSLTDDPLGPYIVISPALDGTSYGVVVTVAGTVANSQGAPGVVTDVASLTYVVNSGSPLFPQGAITYDGAGVFSQQFQTIGISGSILVKVRATDLHGHATEQSMTLIDNLPGPTLTIDTYPSVYSSLSWTGISVTGAVGDSASQLGGSLAYVATYTGGQAGAAITINQVPDPDTFAFTATLATPTPPINGNVTLKVKAIDGSGRDTESSVFIADDPAVPYIVRGDLAPDNSYVDVTFSEPVYTTVVTSPRPPGPDPLTTGDLKLSFVRNGGAATAAAITDATRTDGSALQGGELVIRVVLSITGSPSGVETIAIQPFNGASVYDYVGNAMSAAATTGTINLGDQSAPAAPGTPDLDAADDLGTSNSDDITSKTSGLTFSGSGVEPYAIITLFSDIQTIISNTTTVTSGGTWSLDVSLGAGTHQITATATDATSHESPPSTPLTVVIDTGAPSAPGTPDLDPADDSGLATNDDITKNTTGLTFTVSASEPGTIKLYTSNPPVEPTTRVGQVTATGAGSFTIDNIALSAGTYQMTATLTDTGGTTGPASGALALTVDTVAPPAPGPGAPDLATADDSGRPSVPADNTDNTTSTVTNLTFSGSGGEDTGRIWVYSSVDGLLGFATPSGGTWTADGLAIPTPFTDGSRNIYATSQDAAGNVSGPSSNLPITIDTTAPSVPADPPSGLNLADADDLGLFNNDNVTSQTTALTFNGQSAVANGRVTLYSSITGSLGYLDTVASGNWSGLDVSLPQGTHNVTARIMDTAGNESGPTSTPLAVTTDTTNPAAPTAPDLDSADDSGRSGVPGDTSDDITKNTTNLTFSGTGAESGSRVTLYSSVDGSKGTATADGAGAWTINATGSFTANTTHLVTAVVTDLAGNNSSASPSLSLTVDTTAPSAPAAPDLDAADDSGRPGDAGDTTDNRTNVMSNLSFTGASGAEVDGRINIYSSVDSGVRGYFDTSSAGSWNVDNVALTSTGSHTITAKSMDAAGNESGASGILAVIIDTTAPGAPTGLNLASLDDSGDSSDNYTSVTTNLTFNGNSAPNPGRVTLYSDIQASPGYVDTSSTSWILDVSMSAGTHSLTARAMDVAGNESGDSSPLSPALIIDTSVSAPSAPDLATADDTGASATDDITKDTTNLTFAGTGAEAGALVTLYSDVQGSRGTGTADGSGAWSIDASLSAGTHQMTAVQRDVAWNVSAASSALQVVVDTSVTTPNTPVLTTDSGVTGDDKTNDNTPSFDVTLSGDEEGTLRLYEGSTEIASTAVDGSTGTYAITVLSALTEGVHTIKAELTDTAGNVSSKSSGLTVTVDTTPPTVTDVDAAADSYIANALITVQVTFSEPVTVTGSPLLQLKFSSTTPNATGAPGTGVTQSFTYTDTPSDSTADLDFNGSSALTLNGGTIADAAGNAANLTVNDAVGAADGMGSAIGGESTNVSVP